MELIDQVGERDEWLASRRLGIGGSDVAALFGVHPWLSPYTLYLDKLGLLPEREDRAILNVGHELEPLTRRMYTEDTGRIVDAAQERFRHPKHEFMLATIDGTLAPCDGHTGPGVFEGKTTNPYSANDWIDGPPLYYLLQLTHYMVVTGRTWGSIAVLVLGEKDPLKWADVDLDAEFAEMMVEAERLFWTKHVLAQVPPDVDGHPSTTAAIKAMHPQDSGMVVELDDVAMSWRDELELTKAHAKELAARRDVLENRVKAAMRDATYAVLPDGTGWSWQTSDRREYMVKANSIRTLRSVSSRAMDKAKRDAEKLIDKMILR